MKTFWRQSISLPLRRTMADVPWFGPTISAVLVALSINVLTDTLSALGGPLLSWAIVLLLILCTAGFIYAYNRRYGRWLRTLGPIAEVGQPQQYPGLIFIFSNEATLSAAIEHHLPVLTHCWLILTPEKGADAPKIHQSYPQVRFVDLHVPNLYIAQACYEAVRSIFQQGARSVGLAPEQVIADITGGTKPMSMGMIVACLERGAAVEHVPTRFGPDNKPLGPLPPIEIRVTKS